MRKLLLLALLLYDIVAFAVRSGYDYEEYVGSKRHPYDDRRNWRKKALQKPYDSDQKEWDDRRRYESHNAKYADDIDNQGYGGIDRHRRLDVSGPIYKDNRRFDDMTKMKIPPNIRSSEIDHAPLALEKDVQKKIIMNCERQHERFEACFAGCASVTCDNPRERLRPCYPFCEPGCVCNHPYVRDDRTHKCVLPEDCSKGLKGVPDLGEEV